MSNNTYSKQKMLAFFACAWALSGCTTLSVMECQEADWYHVGAVDGSRGESADQLSQYVNACGAFYLAPDKAQYKAGYEQGIKAYCTHKNGDALGQKDRLFREVCPVGSRADIARGYRSGKNIYDLDQQIKAQEAQIKLTTEKVMNKSTSSKDRVELDKKLKKITDEMLVNKTELAKAIEGSPNGFFVNQPFEKLMIDVNLLPKKQMQTNQESNAATGVGVQSAPIAPSITNLPNP